MIYPYFRRPPQAIWENPVHCPGHLFLIRYRVLNCTRSHYHYNSPFCWGGGTWRYNTTYSSIIFTMRTQDEGGGGGGYLRHPCTVPTSVYTPLLQEAGRRPGGTWTQSPHRTLGGGDQPGGSLSPDVRMRKFAIGPTPGHRVPQLHCLWGDWSRARPIYVGVSPSMGFLVLPSGGPRIVDQIHWGI